MIDVSEVATVRKENTLMHALMLLQNVGYSSIPVTDNRQKLCGIITMPAILRGIQDEVKYDWDKLNEMKVGDVMCPPDMVLREDFTLEDVLRVLVNHNFSCVVDDKNTFLGIITRKNMLQRMNYMAHEFDNFYEAYPFVSEYVGIV